MLVMRGREIRFSFLKPGETSRNEGFPGAGIIIAESEFIVAGHGFSVEFQAKPGHPPYVAYLSIDEGEFENGAWKIRANPSLRLAVSFLRVRSIRLVEVQQIIIV
ncbi:DUF5597 domain-containing protein [Paenibacillus solisilvae]|uniref:DUF5597 domain-containing protein n=1 Tax=Paenibacillus solisilvae TaxID=2486751 RepID=A0ABW0VXW0_9BACL